MVKKGSGKSVSSKKEWPTMSKATDRSIRKGLIININFKTSQNGQKTIFLNIENQVCPTTPMNH